jgi:serine/threonine-protein kinase PDIK1L
MIGLVDMFMNWQENMDTESTLSSTPIHTGTLSDADEAMIRLTAMPRYVCIVNDYYKEGDLKSYILHYQGMIPETLIISFTMQLCSLLNYLHGQQPPVLHRDMKPENVLMSDNGTRVVVTDFGLAKNTEQTYMTTQAGSLPFVAPECWQRRYSTKIDIWAVGCIIYALGTKRASPTATKVMFSEATKHGFADEIREDLKDYSPRVAELVLLLLTLDPHERPSAGGVMEFLVSNFQIQRTANRVINN